MLNIIVYAQNKLYIDKDVKTVNKILSKYYINYNVYSFGDCNNALIKLVNNNNLKKIYLIDIDCEFGINSGFELASKIRMVDYDSVIILIFNNYKVLNMFFENRLMIFDFINKNDDNYLDRLKDDLFLSFKVIYRLDVFSFKYNNIIYNIPYYDINYIEKESSIKRCVVHTTNDNFYVVDSIKSLSDMLGVNFVRTHQSCIVNINNILKIDCSKKIIVFKNGDETSLLNNTMKKIIKEVI